MTADARNSNFSAFSIKSKLSCDALKFRFFALKFEFAFKTCICHHVINLFRRLFALKFDTPVYMDNQFLTSNFMKFSSPVGNWDYEEGFTAGYKIFYHPLIWVVNWSIANLAPIFQPKPAPAWKSFQIDTGFFDSKDSENFRVLKFQRCENEPIFWFLLN